MNHHQSDGESETYEDAIPVQSFTSRVHRPTAAEVASRRGRPRASQSVFQVGKYIGFASRLENGDWEIAFQTGQAAEIREYTGSRVVAAYRGEFACKVDRKLNLRWTTQPPPEAERLLMEDTTREHLRRRLGT